MPFFRKELLQHISPLTRAEDLGTDGENVGSFWPDFAGVGRTIPIGDVAPDVMSRILLLGKYKVDLDEYRRDMFLERAIICRSLTCFLNAASIGPSYYVRYQYTASESFVRWLQGDRDELRGSLVRWLNPVGNRDLGRIVRDGLPGRQEPWPATATQFHLFQMSDTWFLVPETPAADDDFSSQFWQIGVQLFEKGWTQQEEMAFILRGAELTETISYVIQFTFIGVGQPRHVRLMWPPQGTRDFGKARPRSCQ